MLLGRWLTSSASAGFDRRERLRCAQRIENVLEGGRAGVSAVPAQTVVALAGLRSSAHGASLTNRQARCDRAQSCVTTRARLCASCSHPRQCRCKIRPMFTICKGCFRSMERLRRTITPRALIARRSAIERFLSLLRASFSLAAGSGLCTTAGPSSCSTFSQTMV